MTPAAPMNATVCRNAIAALPFVAAEGLAAFRLALPGGRRVPLQLRVAENWAELLAEPGEPAGRLSFWDALALNGSADGAAKLILRPGGPVVALRADVPLAGADDPAPRLAEASDDLRRLAAALERAACPAEDGGAGNDVRAAAESPGASRPRRGDSADIAELLTEAGWPFVRRAADRLAVDLGLADRFQQAFITPAAGGRHRVRATLPPVGALAPASQAALGVLLLTASSAVRVARGGRAAEDGQSALCIDATLPGSPTEGDLDLALCALAAACRLAGREAGTLTDERLARAYLAARGWAV